MRLGTPDRNDNISGYDSDDPCLVRPNYDPDEMFDNENMQALNFNDDRDFGFYFAGPTDGFQTPWISSGNTYVMTWPSCYEPILYAPRREGYSWSRNNYRGEVSFDEPDLGQ